ncbi:MAG: hypothetical protein EXR43_01425 [Dehalococcoidia bacterium]|nr:hypothetical protein [Dehalococcoidia bacterium]
MPGLLSLNRGIRSQLNVLTLQKGNPAVNGKIGIKRKYYVNAGRQRAGLLYWRCQKRSHSSERSRRRNGLQGTKFEILRLLKRCVPASADELAARLGFASVTIRQHLIALERDALVEVHTVRRGPGRPCYMYRLSAKGDATFPRGYDELARGLLREIALLHSSDIADLRPEEKTILVLNRYADRIASRYLHLLEGQTQGERIRRAIEVLQSESGFIEVDEGENGVLIRDFNCAYRMVANLEGSTCAWHVRLMGLLVGCEVGLTSEANIDCCTVFVARPSAEVSPEAERAVVARRGE